MSIEYIEALSRAWNRMTTALFEPFDIGKWFVLGFTAFLAGLFTCCLGFTLLAIPYIGSVVTLPISYTFRTFSLEFLEQFGPGYTIFPRPEDTAASEPI